MPTYLPPPRNWQDFEDLCCDLWSRLWSDPETQKNGRSGQRQAGVDLIGRPKGGVDWVGIQCKHRKDRAALSRTDIEREVERARTFKPPLSKLLIATTAPSDCSAQQVARDITERQRVQGLFSVTVVSWDDILLYLTGYPDLVAKYYPDLVAAFQASLPAPTVVEVPFEFRQHEAAADHQRINPSLPQPELDFLLRIYGHAAGNPANLIDMLKVGAELGLSNSETKRIAQHLMAKGLIKHEMSRYRVTITAAGCRRVEEGAQVRMLLSRDRNAIGSKKGVFVGYSSSDEKWLKRLEVHLKTLELIGLEIWIDQRIYPGSNRKAEVRRFIEDAAIAVLLVSANFFASEFITYNELPLLLSAAEDRGMRIVPLILSDSEFERTALVRFQAFNPISRPLIRMTRSEQERTFADLAAAIEKWVARRYRPRE